MKRLTLIAALFLVTGFSSAVVYENGSQPSGGDVTITSENPWNSTLNHRGELAQNSSGLVSATDFHSEGYGIDFSGQVMLPTPCHSVIGQVRKTGNRSYEFHIRAVRKNASRHCTQQTVYTNYDASFEVDQPFELDIVYRNKTESLVHPELGSDEKKVGDGKSFIQMILDLLPF